MGESGNVVKRISNESGVDDVDLYIAKCPKDIQGKLREVRAAIREVAPDASETTSYFHMPGYFFPGYDYNGMFAWFGFQKSYIGLLLRPPTIESHAKELEGYVRTKSALHLPVNAKVPVPLVKKLVKASIKVMKAKAQDPTSKNRR